MLRKHLSTRRHLRLEPLEDRLCLSSLPVGTSTIVPDAATQARLSAVYGQLPLSFEANQGQTDAQVNFLARGAGYTLFLTPSKAVLGLQQGEGNTGQGVGGDVLQMQLVGANPASPATGQDQQAGKTNYLLGNDPSQWQTEVLRYGRVQYKSVYPGVDLVYYGNQQQLEYDFIVAPGADPSVIRLAFQGARSTAIDAHGNLVLHADGGDVVEHAPVLYQESNGVRQSISGSYAMQANGQVGFQVGSYDPTRSLVIDPVLVYSTFLGGSVPLIPGQTPESYGQGIAVDSSGNAYVTGMTETTNFPTQNPLQGQSMGSEDVFVTKFNASGSALIYSTYLGGSGTQAGESIAVDGSGNAYVTGNTNSTDFPTVNAYKSSFSGGTNDTFVAKLTADGSALAYSTYLGGSGGDSVYSIAVDGSGNAYITGDTDSSDFPTTTRAFQAVYNGGGSSDAFVSKINTSAAGSASLVYSTFLGGNAQDHGQGIAVDGSGSVYVTGGTDSTNFPTTAGAYRQTNAGGTDGFVTKLNASGSGLIYSTYLGGTNSDSGSRIAVDGSGNAYVAGGTYSIDFPITAGAFQTTNGGDGDAFVTKVNPAGSGLVYSTFLGGAETDGPGGIAVDSAGDAYVAGTTDSTDFPTTSAFQTQNLNVTPTASYSTAFVTKLSASGSALVYSTYLGGSNGDSASGIAVDGSGSAYVTGNTSSVDFPITVGAFQTISATTGVTAFVAKIVSQADFLLNYPLPTMAGVSHPFTVTAQNADGTTNTGYRGAVHFTSRDGQAALPADYTFTTTDQGVHTFSAVLNTPRLQSLTATDTATASLTGTQWSITVNPAIPSFAVSGFPSPSTAGAAANFTVIALDLHGNVITGYTGTVTFTCSDGQASLPAPYTFLASDRGQHTFSATLKTARIYQSLTATDGSRITGSEVRIRVNPAAATSLLISAPASVTVGTAFSIGVTAADPYGNIATGYRGTVHFTSSDSTATLPGNYVFTTNDSGVHYFTSGVILRKAGKATVTATDSVKSTITGSVSIKAVKASTPVAIATWTASYISADLGPLSPASSDRLPEPGSSIRSVRVKQVTSLTPALFAPRSTKAMWVTADTVDHILAQGEWLRESAPATHLFGILSSRRGVRSTLQSSP